MAKKPRKLQIEPDGTIILGIHKIPPPPKPIAAGESEEYLKKWVEGANRSAREVIAEFRERLRDVVMPHLEGPIPEDVFRVREGGKPTAEALRGPFYGLDLGNGPEVYRANDYMELHVASDKTRKKAVAAFEKLDQESQIAALMAMDAVEELNELRVALLHLDKDGSRDFLFKTAFRCGWMWKQMQMRDFESLVRSERGRRNRPPETGARLTSDQWSIVREFIKARMGKGDTAMAACEKAHAQLATGTLRGLKGQRIDISAKRLQNRWSSRNK